MQSSCIFCADPALQARACRLQCRSIGRDPATLERVYVSGFTPENPLASMEVFAETVDRYTAIGITELVVHWPVPGSAFDNDMAVFERIAKSQHAE
ncbi:hypothetical protein [Nocardia sp. NPDC051832]|uniref:hypothetical protein n=1 Tax=Nocardia sp. NPDC051832 TaxID=3155673 RepID=UPI00341C2E5D